VSPAHGARGALTPGTWLEVLAAFTRLGVSCFGGPVAHLAFFREEFVVRRRWLDETAYAELVALCQLLPGPASSQVGVSIGLLRAGYCGGLAAWVGFTLPSALLLTAFAYGVVGIHGAPAQGVLHGLRLAAAAIVAQAVWGMARAHCGSWRRGLIAAVAAATVMGVGSSLGQLAAIAVGALAGMLWCRAADPAANVAPAAVVTRRVGLGALGVHAGLMLALPLLRELGRSQTLAVVDAFYRSGALVFGGGHVVLPLLRQAFVGPGWVSDETFLNGYGAAQAVPGPLFSFAAYLGALVGPRGWAGAALGLVSIYVPGLLVLVGVLPFWHGFRRRSAVRAALVGVNAAVVAMLAVTLYTPIWTTSVHTPGDLVVVLVGLLLLTVWRRPPLLVVALSALAGLVLPHGLPGH